MSHRPPYPFTAIVGQERMKQALILNAISLCVEMRGITDPHQRVAVIARRVAYEQDPAAFYREWLPKEEALSQKIIAARDCLAEVEHCQRDLLTIARLASSFKVDGRRTDIVMLKAARANAALAGRSAIAEQDIALAAELALPHRLKRRPFEEATLEPGDIADRLHFDGCPSWETAYAYPCSLPAPRPAEPAASPSCG